jgi:hypothetical protein
METVKVKGQKILLDGKEYILPPLPIKAWSKGDASEKIKKINTDLQNMKTDGLGAVSKESWSNLVDLITTALKRNYPDITEEIVEDGTEDIMALMGMMEYLISQSEDFKSKAGAARKNEMEKFLAEKK